MSALPKMFQCRKLVVTAETIFKRLRRCGDLRREFGRTLTYATGCSGDGNVACFSRVLE
jgi:hypothetical protein